MIKTITIIINTLIWRMVLPMFYLAATNTMLLTYYIQPFQSNLKKPQTDHESETCGVPEIRAPPFV